LSFLRAGDDAAMLASGLSSVHFGATGLNLRDTQLDLLLNRSGGLLDRPRHTLAALSVAIRESRGDSG
jgi:hypothetical protein